MCFHSKQSKSSQEVEKRFKVSIEEESNFLISEQINGFSFPKTPVITEDRRGEVQFFNWGLIPSWSKEENIRKYTLNARIETINEKPSFKENIQNRCLIISNGFYEWKWLDSKGKNKEKYLIDLPEEKLYAYAGIYSIHKDSKTQELIKTYSIVTTEANQMVSEIHRKKRMPIILKQEDEDNWLDGDDIRKYRFPYQVNLRVTNLDIKQTLFNNI